MRPLLALAQEVEDSRTERKLTELLDVVASLGLREDRRRQLLIFTEHKDTLDYLVENLSKDFEVAQIHGQMKLPERIEQERYFRETAQIMVATEAAGEGINLQFCHLMVNYDIPWNPNRLEQRMGRIHRIGQTEDVYIFNLVATNTREGYVLNVLLKKMENMGVALGDKVFDVVGPGHRHQPAGGPGSGHRRGDHQGGSRGQASAARRSTRPPRPGPRNCWKARSPAITWTGKPNGTGLPAPRNVACRRSYFERFFADAITYAGGKVTKRLDPGTWRVDRTPNVLVARSRTASGLRQIAPEYKRLTFDKSIATRPRLSEDEAALPAAELCGPGHPLFDALVSYVIERTAPEVAKGAVFFDPDIDEPTVLRFLTGDVADGNGEIVRRTLAAVRVRPDGRIEPAPAASLFDVVPPTDEIQPAAGEAIPAAAAGRRRTGHVGTPAPVRAGLPGRQEPNGSTSPPSRRTSSSAPSTPCSPRPTRPSSPRKMRATAASRAPRDGSARPNSSRSSTSSAVACAWKRPQRGRNVVRGDVTVIGSALLLPLPAPERRQGAARQVIRAGRATTRSSRSPSGSPAATRPAAAPPCGRSRTSTSASTCCPPAAWNAAASRSRDAQASPGWS